MEKLPQLGLALRPSYSESFSLLLYLDNPYFKSTNKSLGYEALRGERL